tara:strand:+ start:850 stop:1977 length:1128 start_codon:yes stop_codon:yes gene_type:complete
LKNKSLLIISHTNHCINKSGEIVGFSPTIREINFLSKKFKKITHIGCLKKNEINNNYLEYSKNVEFVGIPNFGGKSYFKKLNVILYAPIIIFKVLQYLKKSDIFHFRAPTSIGLYLIPFLILKKNGWFKFAGDWSCKNSSLASKVQKFILHNLNKNIVTYNGFFNAKKHCKSFENPCLDNNQINIGKKIALKKEFNTPFNIVFVGRIENKKGMDTILTTLKNSDEKNKVHRIDFIGVADTKEYETEFKKINGLFCHFHGQLKISQVHDFYKKAHFIILPSKTEGFPKVIAEAACYGVIPIVSDVGSIGHYINSSNGYLVDSSNMQYDFNLKFENALKENYEKLKSKSNIVTKLAKLYTFESYLYKLEKLVFKNVV